MKRCARKLRPFLAVLGALAVPATAQKGGPSNAGFPFQDESLHYNVNWPSGLTLGDATLTAHRSGTGWDLEMILDAAFPGFRIADRFHSVTNPGLCSLEFDRETTHGSKKSSDKTTFDYANGVAHSASVNGGGASSLPIASNCAYDALAFLFVTRRELGQGVVVAPSQILFGPAYSIRLEYTGQQTMTAAEKPAVADRVAVHLKGLASSSTFEIFFARDAARTPLVARIPSSVGAISVELSP